MSRLRTQGGDVVLAAEFISQAEAGGLMPKIDNLVVFRCVQVLRRLLIKNREVGVFCNLSVATLTDAVVFPQLLEFLDANRAIAPSLVLEFTQSGLPDLLGRFGIDLVAERIESEGSVVDLLDYDVKFGQGFLFSPPRPVRAEALQGADAAKTDAADQAERDAAATRGAGLAQLARTGSGRP